MHTSSFNTQTHTLLQSSLKATSLPIDSYCVSVFPVVPVWLCWCLASLTGALKLTAWFVLQHKHAWQHQFPWYDWEAPGIARDCVFYIFRLNCSTMRSWWAAASSTLHSSALCLVLIMTVIHSPVDYISSWYFNVVCVCLGNHKSKSLQKFSLIFSPEVLSDHFQWNVCVVFLSELALTFVSLKH